MKGEKGQMGSKMNIDEKEKEIDRREKWGGLILVCPGKILERASTSLENALPLPFAKDWRQTTTIIHTPLKNASHISSQVESRRKKV